VGSDGEETEVSGEERGGGRGEERERERERKAACERKEAERRERRGDDEAGRGERGRESSASTPSKYTQGPSANSPIQPPHADTERLAQTLQRDR
jgi:hypothetical protein